MARTPRLKDPAPHNMSSASSQERAVCIGLFLTAVALWLSVAVGCQTTQDQSDNLRHSNQPDLDYLPVLVKDEKYGPGYEYTTEELNGSGHRTVLTIYGRANDSEFEHAHLRFICDSRARTPAAIAHLYAIGQDGESALVSRAGRSSEGQAKVKVRFEPEGNPDWQQWGFEEVENGFVIWNAWNLMHEAKRFAKIWIQIPVAGRIIEAVFYPHAALRTKIQPNLDWCGQF